MKVDLLGGKVPRVYFTLLISAIGSTILTTIYSTVDMICVGQYCGSDGAAAISCMNPLWSLMFALGVLAGVGGAVMASNRRGIGDESEARGYFTVSVIISLIFSFVLLLCYTVFAEPMLRFFGAEGRVLEYAIDYMKPIAIVSPTFTMCACLATFVRNDGEAIIPTVATAVGGVINIILDILLVFTADLGAFGAGLATAIGQTAAFVIILGYFFLKRCSLRLVSPTRPFAKLGRISTVGFSAFVLELSFGITVMVFNNVIRESFPGSVEVYQGIYGIASSVTVMFFCLFNGIGTALQPIVSTNFGAGKRDRVVTSVKLAFISALILGILFFAVAELFPDIILKIYMDSSSSPEVLTQGPGILRAYTSALPIIGITIVCTYLFQSILKQNLSVCLSLLRGLVLPVAVILLTLVTGRIELIWWSVPIAEAITFIVALVFLLIVHKRKRAVPPLTADEL